MRVILPDATTYDHDGIAAQIEFAIDYISQYLRRPDRPFKIHISTGSTTSRNFPLQSQMFEEFFEILNGKERESSILTGPICEKVIELREQLIKE